mmetsp:Transcript_98047/g.272865  ORF Transcript_98047/g.272865 Transcript_98047/m.272865 type:complete len:114 (+) Transcript_98047:438-779(+)
MQSNPTLHFEQPIGDRFCTLQHSLTRLTWGVRTVHCGLGLAPWPPDAYDFGRHLQLELSGSRVAHAEKNMRMMTWSSPCGIQETPRISRGRNQRRRDRVTKSFSSVRWRVRCS